MFGTADNRGTATDQRRRLHVQIARSRRRLNQYPSRLILGGFLPSFWRRHTQDRPLVALATAVGVGMLLARLHRGATSKSANHLTRWLSGATWNSLLQQAERFLTTREPNDPLRTPERDDA